jgi:tellurite resistance protein TerC
VFAILGLRSLYFALAGVMELFHYLHYGLAVILALIGVKMLISGWYEVPTAWALGMVGAVLIVSIAASLLHKKQ